VLSAVLRLSRSLAIITTTWAVGGRLRGFSRVLRGPNLRDPLQGRGEQVVLAPGLLSVGLFPAQKFRLEELDLPLQGI
jgi:hypothetical protein